MAAPANTLGEGPYTNSEFSSMLITLYQSNYLIRVPNFEIVFNNPLPSIGASNNFDPIPAASAEYVGEVEAIIANLPVGYLCDIYTPETEQANSVTGTTNDINTYTYQNTESGWLLQAPVQSHIVGLNNTSQDNLD